MRWRSVFPGDQPERAAADAILERAVVIKTTGLPEGVVPPSASLTPPKPGRLLCGAELGDGYLCKRAAGHEFMGIRCNPDASEALVLDTSEDNAKERAKTEALLNASPGLRRYLEPTAAEIRAEAVIWAGAPSAVETADEQRPLPEWCPEYKLRHSLGRPGIAHRVVLQLDTQTAVELAEVIESLFERRMREVQIAIAEQTEEALARMHADASQKLREVTNERFDSASRLD
jgi:hypothetical protein